jgi:putative methylase
MVMKKKTLEMKLQALIPYSGKAELEQYNTPADIAADMLCIAHSFGDLQGRKVVDLGCGNGIFAIGAVLLGADRAVGVEVDSDAVAVAEENTKNLGTDVVLVNSDIKDFSERCDTVLQNPPFGAQRANKHADAAFIGKAFEIARVAYSLHLSKTEDFVLKSFELCGGAVTMTKRYKFPIVHTYPFHRKERLNIEVSMVRGVKDDV